MDWLLWLVLLAEVVVPLSLTLTLTHTDAGAVSIMQEYMACCTVFSCRPVPRHLLSFLFLSFPFLSSSSSSPLLSCPVPLLFSPLLSLLPARPDRSPYRCERAAARGASPIRSSGRDHVNKSRCLNSRSAAASSSEWAESHTEWEVITAGWTGALCR